MPRPLSVLGSTLLVCGVAAFVAVPGNEAPAAPNDASTDSAAAPSLVRVASAEAAPLRLPENADPSTRALYRTIALLQDGIARAKDVPAYTAVFEKREVVDGVLLDPQVMDLTLRHEPFGVHLAWVEGQRGRTVMYEEGRNDGEMLVNPGGWRGRLTGTLQLNVNGSLAKSEARHPITDVGMERLAKTLLRYRLGEVGNVDAFECRLSEGFEYDGRPVWKNEMIYRSPEHSRQYRRSVALIDREWNLPVKVETFGWPTPDIPADQLDARTLIERYSYTAVDFDSLKDPADTADLVKATGFCVK